ncbi:hypothetical protein MKZ38_005419 [Zalerion maritima]|uniref:Uncharacterized protein n=1 Tax=Zalerion maritima TaxID=339359 RepID=A0AAD5RKP2_9PEZI|nr:hypothetical protein MKZ38_005419 [Zalerion maritima]
MGTRVRTTPRDQPQGSSRQGTQSDWPQRSSSGGTAESKPQIYVHFEFGVSWTPSNQPKNHSCTYMSQGIRDRQHAQASSRDVQPLNHFTRHVPPPTTNYLAPVPRSNANYYCQDSAVDHHQQYAQPHSGNAKTRRSGRQNDRSAQHHERGSSAPPPISDSPWDSNLAPGPSSHPVQQRHQAGSRQHPQIWKDLPPRPGQNRGSFGIEAPWEGGGDMVGFAEYHPDHDQTIDPTPTPHRQYRRGERERRERDETLPFVNNPTVVPVDSRMVPTRAVRRGEDPARVRDLEALGSAMMTVDNGFENQWWYQGQREFTQEETYTNANTEAAADFNAIRNRDSFLSDSGVGYFNSCPADSFGNDESTSSTWVDLSAAEPAPYVGPIMPAEQMVSPNGYYGPREGCAVRSRDDTYHSGFLASPTPDTPYLRSRMRNESMVVSPMTEVATPHPQHGLNRSLTTRSEELHF